jgi:hypothetical protein
MAVVHPSLIDPALSDCGLPTGPRRVNGPQEGPATGPSSPRGENPAYG